jgi:predicted nucleic acid-binding protein
MTYLVDSDRVADYLKGHRNAVQLLDRLFGEGLAISIITFGEIYEGIYYGHNPKENEAAFRRFVRGVDVLGINRSVARRFAIIRGDLREKGTLVSQPDLLIAATALHYGLVLVTRNLSHFERILGITIYKPK